MTIGCRASKSIDAVLLPRHQHAAVDVNGLADDCGGGGAGQVTASGAISSGSRRRPMGVRLGSCFFTAATQRLESYSIRQP